MISRIKTNWLFISLPIISTAIFQTYETFAFSSVFIPLYIIGSFSLKKLETYSINQKELNKIKLISYINDNIENTEIILPKLKELKSYYNNYNIELKIKTDLSNDYSNRQHLKMLNNIKQNYKQSNSIIKSELNKNDEIIANYRNCIDKLINIEPEVKVIINQ